MLLLIGFLMCVLMFNLLEHNFYNQITYMVVQLLHVNEAQISLFLICMMANSNDYEASMLS